MAFATEKFRQAFGDLFKDFADNWCDLVVDAVEERLNVEGFRLGSSPAGDDKAWSIWQANGLDAMSQIAHTEGLINGIVYALVDPFITVNGEPRITIEHPSQTTVVTAPSDPRERIAALKMWDDEFGQHFATLFLPEVVHKYQRDGGKWVPRDGEPELENPFGRVPVVQLANRPRLLKDGVSEIHKVMPVQDAINKEIADMLVASEFSAFFQRWATGIEIPRDEQGNQLEPFKVSVDRLFVAENPDAKFGTLQSSDLSNYVKVIEMLVQHVASQTRTPPHYFYLSGEFPSGESIKSAETGLVAKTRRKMRFFGEAWEEVIRLAFAAKGRSKRGLSSIETIWADPESRTESEMVDAAVKRQAIGVPNRQLQEDVGYSQVQIERFAQMRREDASQPAPPAPVPPPAA